MIYSEQYWLPSSFAGIPTSTLSRHRQFSIIIKETIITRPTWWNCKHRYYIMELDIDMSQNRKSKYILFKFLLPETETVKFRHCVPTSQDAFLTMKFSLQVPRNLCKALSPDSSWASTVLIILSIPAWTGTAVRMTLWGISGSCLQFQILRRLSNAEISMTQISMSGLGHSCTHTLW